jgi:CheY-like chemotaxis protein
MAHVHPTVLMIEDNDDVREAVTELIRSEGYAVEAVRDGAEALAALETIRPCVIVLDLYMPNLSGVEFRRAQLADPELRDIPIVVFSAAPDVAEQAQRMQAVAFAGKPVPFASLMALIRQHCLK